MSLPAILGHSGNTDIAVDLDRLVGSHMAIVANAGGGKSGAIRRLLETTHGHIQHIVLDIEDEFYTMRQSYDYVIAGGEGGDVPARPENAAALATAALTHGFSMIVQMNDLGSDGAADFVDRFLSAMLSAPQELWHPVLVVIDETQRFDPASIRMLTERGRKRGFTAVLASQRLPKIDANIRGDINNWIMGRVGQSLDRRIMADQLGFSAREATEHLQRIQPRHFWAFGPALAEEPVLFRVGDVETTMVKPGQGKVATPPPPEAMRSILAGLAVSEPDECEVDRPHIEPKQAEWGGEVKRLREQVEQLRGERDEWTVEQAYGQQQLEALANENKALRDIIGRAHADIARIRPALEDTQIPAQGGGGPQREQGQHGAESSGSGSPAAVPVERAPAKPQRASGRGAGQGVAAGETANLTNGARKLVETMARHHPRSLPMQQIARLAGVSMASSQWRVNERSFEDTGLAEPAPGNQWRLSAAGIAHFGVQAQPDDPSAIRAFWLAAFPPSTAEMLRVVLDAKGHSLSRETIADEAGVSRTSSGLSGGLRELKLNGLIVETRDGYQAAEFLL